MFHDADDIVNGNDNISDLAAGNLTGRPWSLILEKAGRIGYDSESRPMLLALLEQSHLEER